MLFITESMLLSRTDLNTTNANLDSIVQLLSIDEYDGWHDYFYEFLSSTICEHNMSWKSIIIVSIQIKFIILSC